MVEIEGSNFPEDLYYDKNHMWVKVENGKVRVGYNDWAQEAAGKLVNLNTRRVGRSVKAGKTLGTVESGKWVGPLRAPVSGKILEINQEVMKRPALINEDPYGGGWIAIIEAEELDTDIKDLIKGSDTEALETWLKEEKAKHLD
jgi:glycine cleavage system H protein